MSKRSKNKIFKGVGTISAFLCALCLGVYSVASSGDYKDTVNSILGKSLNGTASSGSSETYSYTSDYDSLQGMLTRRVSIAEQLGEEGCVLLKNDNSALPLVGGGYNKVTVLGNRAYTYKNNGDLRDTSLTFYGGITGSVILEQTVVTDYGTISSPVTIETAFANENIEINPSMKDFYSSQEFTPLPQGSEAADAAGGAYDVKEPYVSVDDVRNSSDYDDACFVVIGRTSGEGRDYLPGSSGVKEGSSQKSAIGLSDEERQLIAVADSIAHGKVIVLINSAVAMEIDELKNDDRVNSILWIGLPGSYGMNGVARVITGKASPSGHLTDTYAVEASNAPAARNFGDGDPDGTAKYSWSNGDYTRASNGHYVVLAEDIYTGYYYYETRYNDSVLNDGNATSAKGAVTGADRWTYEDEVSYPFGYGLSYTTFSQEIVEDSFRFVDSDEEQKVMLSVNVTNTGSVAGKDVVQLYVQAPYTDYDRRNGVEKSAIQLIGFEKTDVLEPGESTTVEISADLKYFASYDENANHDGVTGGYIIEKGDYHFAIGNGAHEAVNNILANCIQVNSSSLYLEDGSSINQKGTVSWNSGEEAIFSFDSNGVDSTYFSKSESGTLIQNQMQDADYNYFDTGTEVKYLSRNDWDGTYPVSYTGLPTVSSMDKYLRYNASVYEFGTSGTKGDNVQFDVDHTEEYDDSGVPLENTDIASYKGKSYDDEDWDYLLQQISFEEAWKFAPLGGTKCEMFKSVNAPEVWQIDGPNGNVNRGYSANAPTTGVMGVSKSDPNAGYKSCDMPCEPMVGATFNKELLNEEGKIFAEDSLWSRNPIMWAPGMNLHRTQFNSRNHEYYSEDPMLTNLLGTSFVRGGLEKGAILSAKHFAFNTQESYREGLSQFFDEQAGREMELRAFQGLCEDVDYVNTSGNRLDALGLMSTFSRVGVCGANGHTGMMKNILRGEWGFKGLISTDMVSRTGFFNPQDAVINNVTFMATSSGESFLASSDWSDYNNKQLVQGDPNMMNALYENMHYYMYSIANSSALNGISPGEVIQDSMSWWQVMLIAIGSSLGGISLAVIIVGIWLEVRRDKRLVKASCVGVVDNTAGPNLEKDVSDHNNEEETR